MFSRFSRLPLRRCLHSYARPPTSSKRIGPTLAASAIVAATYFTWRLNNSIALDSKSEFPSAPKPATPPIPNSGPQNSIVPEPVEPNNTPETTESPGQDVIHPSPDAEEESSPSDDASGGAFNPVTGEINWDCPCLGGMAHGPCGPQFREAFSCFVFSEEEPKGINCVEKFKGMQDCFREHPETYGDEIMDDDEDSTPVSGEDASSLPRPDLDNPKPESVPKTTDPTTQRPLSPDPLGSSGSA